MITYIALYGSPCHEPSPSLDDEQEGCRSSDMAKIALAIIGDLALFAAAIASIVFGWWSYAIPHFFTHTLPSTLTPFGAGALIAAIPLLTLTAVLVYKVYLADSKLIEKVFSSSHDDDMY